MKKMTVVVICVAILLYCCSCGFVKETDTYKDHIDEIQTISIVELGEYNSETYRFTENMICEISNIETFEEELLNVACDTNWGDPQQLYTGELVVKITYNNLDFDLISWRAQLKNRSGKNNYGHMVFDKEQFESLISKYI